MEGAELRKPKAYGENMECCSLVTTTLPTPSSAADVDRSQATSPLVTGWSGRVGGGGGGSEGLEALFLAVAR